VVMTPLLAAFVCSATIAVISGQTSEITAENIDDLRVEVREVMDRGGNNHQLLARIVRLAFHDCSGPFDDGTGSGCNGCIDLENDDHAGMQSIINPLELVYDAWSGDMSRADFWATAATIALEYAKELDTEFPDDTLPSMPYYFGRVDCESSPDATDTKQFASAAWGFQSISAWFQEHLDFNSREIVTIIGAHTLGKAHQQWSGYSSERWKRRGPDMLNNVFYQNLLNFEWQQLTSPRGKYEWRVEDQGRDILMLNSDMSLIIHIDDYFHPLLDDRVLCLVDTCPASEVRSIVEEFAGDNQLWLNEFVTVFQKMITTGYSADELTVLYANPLPAAHSVAGALQTENGVAARISHSSLVWQEYGVVWFGICLAAACLAVGYFIGNCLMGSPATKDLNYAADK